MPNGVSSLFFAGKNLIYGTKEDNIFKEGIGVIQSVRSADFLARPTLQNIQTPNVSTITPSKGTTTSTLATVTSKNPILSFISSAAQTLKKFLYPLIIASGIYNTVKADDKLKTGAEQAGGIGLMFASEQLAEKGLNVLEKKLLSSPSNKTGKLIKVGWYILKGAMFVSASLLGYKAGSSIGGESIDAIRDINDEIEFKKLLKSQQNPQEKSFYQDI